ncbi:hypothetical protein KJ865_13775 [Myxococcota bacterium]|nr:hypothetical protein [Myxococcota bacterium]MBU1611495.1 hypothetical protein [Pseudomonadota bacterium]
MDRKVIERAKADLADMLASATYQRDVAHMQVDDRLVDSLERIQVALTELEGAAGYHLKYRELLMTVGNKYPEESRHETALRYLRAAEQGADLAVDPCVDVVKEASR